MSCLGYRVAKCLARVTRITAETSSAGSKRISFPEHRTQNKSATATCFVSMCFLFTMLLLPTESSDICWKFRQWEVLEKRPANGQVALCGRRQDWTTQLAFHWSYRWLPSDKPPYHCQLPWSQIQVIALLMAGCSPKNSAADSGTCFSPMTWATQLDFSNLFHPLHLSKKGTIINSPASSSMINLYHPLTIIDQYQLLQPTSSSGTTIRSGAPLFKAVAGKAPAANTKLNLVRRLARQQQPAIAGVVNSSCRCWLVVNDWLFASGDQATSVVLVFVLTLTLDSSMGRLHPVARLGEG